jgi:hypothetical protein
LNLDLVPQEDRPRRSYRVRRFVVWPEQLALTDRGMSNSAPFTVGHAANIEQRPT